MPTGLWAGTIVGIILSAPVSLISIFFIMAGNTGVRAIGGAIAAVVMVSAIGAGFGAAGFALLLLLKPSSQRDPGGRLGTDLSEDR
jgi:hypothetical protein